MDLKIPILRQTEESEGKSFKRSEEIDMMEESKSESEMNILDHPVINVAAA